MVYKDLFHIFQKTAETLGKKTVFLGGAIIQLQFPELPFWGIHEGIPLEANQEISNGRTHGL